MLFIYFQIFYMEDAGFSLVDIAVDDSIKIAMWKAIKHFKSNGLHTAPVSRHLAICGLTMQRAFATIKWKFSFRHQ